MSNHTKALEDSINKSKEFKAKLYFNSGIMKAGKRKYDAAKSDFSKAIELDPKN